MSRNRALVGLGLATSSATVALTGSTSAAAATPVKGALWLSGVKWVGLAAVVVAAAAATVVGTERRAGSTHARGSAVADSVRTPEAPVGARSVSEAPGAGEHQSAQAEPAASQPAEPAASQPAEPAASQPAESAAQPSRRGDAVSARARPDDLGEEISLLQRARSALHSGDGSAADSALRAYAQRFPTGRLRPEAMVLRVDVLVQRGETAQARTLARRFTKAYPNSPHAVRLRTLE